MDADAVEEGWSHGCHPRQRSDARTLKPILEEMAACRYLLFLHISSKTRE
jgi:hypothetical protein